MTIPTYEEAAQIQLEAEKIEEDINELLYKKEYDLVIRKMNATDTLEISHNNQRIYILYIMTNLIDCEIKAKGFTTLENKNTSQIIRIYKILSLFYRRMEFEFSAEEQKEIMDFIKHENIISAEILLGVIQNNIYIINKQKVIANLSKILEKG